MKRSEMKKLIEDEVVRFVLGATGQDFSEILLNTCENAGMIPPPYIMGNIRLADWEPEE